MIALKQMAGASFASLLLLAASIAALPTADITGLSTKADQPLSCFSAASEVHVDQGWEMWTNAEAFCKKFDAAIIPAFGNVTSSAQKASHGIYYNFEVINSRCETQQVNADDCMSQFNEILFGCNIGERDLNVGGSVRTDCGQVVLKPSSEEFDPPTSESNEATLAARDIYPDGCNPPVWSACTSKEKSLLLNNACDFRLCLMAGNCATC